MDMAMMAQWAAMMEDPAAAQWAQANNVAQAPQQSAQAFNVAAMINSVAPDAWKGKGGPGGKGPVIISPPLTKGGFKDMAKGKIGKGKEDRPPKPADAITVAINTAMADV